MTSVYASQATLVVGSLSRTGWGEPAERAVASLPVVEDLQVRKARIGQLYGGWSSPAVEQFGLHPAPECFDGGVVVGVTDGVHRGSGPITGRNSGSRSSAQFSARSISNLTT